MSAQIEPRRFNVSEYYKMAKAGILKPDDRVELIEGEIIKMSPIGSPHAACVRGFDNLLRLRLGGKGLISIQSPVRLNEFSEPEPDLALLKPQRNLYKDRHPKPGDVLL